MDNYLIDATVPFTYDGNHGRSYADITENAPVIVEGALYTVFWDGLQYFCKGKKITLMENDVAVSYVSLGNPSLVDLTNETYELFLYLYNETTSVFYTKEGGTEHAIAICEGTATLPEGYLMHDRTIASFQQNTDGTSYYCLPEPAMPIVKAGFLYTVIFDGLPCACVAKKVVVETGDTPITLYILGNASLASAGEDTGEPFVMISYNVEKDIDQIQTVLNGRSHTISIYNGILEKTGSLVENMTVAFSSDQGMWLGLNPNGSLYTTDGFYLMTSGLSYSITINGTTYERTAQVVSPNGVTYYVGIGNTAAFGGENNGDLFAAGFVPLSYSSSMLALVWLDESTYAQTFVVSVYSNGIMPGYVPPVGGDIVLWDRSGYESVYSGVETISVDTENGDIQYFTRGTAVDEEVVAPNFAAGDQVITATDADLMKSVVLQKPEALVPENIAKDVDLFGIVGTHQGGGGESLPPSDINFYDYDGTIVAAWTLEELAAATALPSNPEHEGLISQGWNWSLEDLKTEASPMNVGQMYITDDGKTRLYITIPAESRMNVPLYFSQTVTNGVTIDWGDGASAETLSGTGNIKTTHLYTAPGNYMITLLPDSGCALGLGGNATTMCVMGSNRDAKIFFCGFLKKVEIGQNVTELRRGDFQYCVSMESITIPMGVTSIGIQTFNYCYSLKSITMPSGMTSIGDSAFSYAQGLRGISIPKSITSFASNTFAYCSWTRIITIPSSIAMIPISFMANCLSLASLTVPKSVTSLKGAAFSNCYGLYRLHLRPTTPPTITATSFTNIQSDCIIYVPKGSLSAYQTATNWSTYASYMQEEP